jgi:hypothetical protein
MAGIQYLTYQQINKQKWDGCIDNAGNGLIYAYSFYLDVMAENWDALVLDDYKAVMPLTWRKKYGICYLYQPPFTASLGVFGNNLTAQTVNNFLNAVPSKFQYWDIYLNYGNYFTLTDYTLYKRMNYVLSLEKDYTAIAENFRDNIKRNIKKCEQLGGEVKKEIAVANVIALAKQQAKTFSKMGDDDFTRVEKLYNQLHAKQLATTYGIFHKQKLLASAAFFFSHNRAYYILVGNHPDGKTMGASHALVNAFIKDYSYKNILLDFEGSDINSLAFFYSSFGAAEEKFSGIKLNRLPALLKWMKK